MYYAEEPYETTRVFGNSKSPQKCPRILAFFVRFSADFKGDLWQDFKFLTRFGDFIKDFVHFARDSVSYFVGFLVILNEDLEF